MVALHWREHTPWESWWVRDACDELEAGVKGDEVDTVDATLSELSKAYNLFRLAIQRIGNDSKESGDVEDAYALGDAGSC